jgi:prolyl oligopeptidase
MRRAATLFFAVFAATAAFAANEGKPMDDPYIWLEDIHGEKPLAWVKAENAKSLGHLKADPAYQKNYDFILNVLDAKDRIPYGGLDHGFVYNFWQDAEHPKGVWRRTTIADYAAPAPHWDILIDHDKLAADEKENWVWKGSECSPSQKHCLVHLSRGGGDAVVVREFDPAAKRFIMDGFTLTEAKSTATYIDDDHILFATDFGKGSLTDSGYPRIVKMFQRGVPIDRSMQVFEGEIKDVASQPVVFRDASGPIPIIVRAVDFFDSEYYYMHLDGGTVKLPIPLGADVKGVISGRLIFTLRKDWNFGDTGISKGTLVSYRLEPGIQKDPIDAVDVIYSPSAKSSVESVATGRDAVYVSVLNNVIGEVHAFRFQEGKWTDKKLPLPDGGSANIISTNDFGPEVYLSFESFLKPTTLYADNGGDTPKEIKSLPPRFDATGLETVQYEATSKDGTKIPYFVVRSKTLKGPAPTILYGYGGFEISETPHYSANFGKLWVRQGRRLCAGQYPRRRRIRSRLARSGAEDQSPEGVRRFRRHRRRSHRAENHHRQTARHRRRLQRRPLGLHRDDPASRTARRRGLPGAADRHDPLHPDRRRRFVDCRIRRSGRSQDGGVHPQL